MVNQHVGDVFGQDMAVDLLLPVAHDAHGRDDERLTSAASQDQTDDLECLSKTHVIGQDASRQQFRGRGDGVVGANIGVAAVLVALPELHRVVLVRDRELGILLGRQPGEALELVRQESSLEGLGLGGHGQLGKGSFVHSKRLCQIRARPEVNRLTGLSQLLYGHLWLRVAGAWEPSRSTAAPETHFLTDPVILLTRLLKLRGLE